MIAVRLRAAAAAALILAMASSVNARAATSETPGPPSQFAAWGTAGPELAVPAAGWTEVSAEPRARDLTEPTREERSRGFVMFERRPQEAVYPDTVPAREETRVDLRAFAARGEYEPLTFALRALADLRGCRVAVSRLEAKGGRGLPTGCVDVRVARAVRSRVDYSNPRDARFRMTPFLLEKREHFDVPADHTAQVWLTVGVPRDARAGDYRGKATVRAEGRPAAEVPVLVRVLPFELPPAAVETVMSYPRPNADRALRERELVDQREHGITNVEAAIGAHVMSRDGRFGPDDVAATRERVREALALRRKVFGAGATPVTAEVGHQILYRWDAPAGWFRYWPRSPEVDADFVKAVGLVAREVEAAGGPPVRIFVMDEPGGHPETLKDTIYYNELVRERFPGLRTWVTIGGGLAQGIDEVGLLAGSIDEFCTNRFTRETCARFAGLGKAYGVYNGGGATEEVRDFARDRYFFGFYGWRTGARQILQWAYAFGDPWAEPVRGNHGYVYPAADGPLPSIPWEGIREGIDDYRYLDLLWRMIGAARGSRSRAARRAADIAETKARAIMAEVRLDYQPLAGAPCRPASASTMDKWRWIVASACLDLSRHVRPEGLPTAPPERPGALDFEEREASAGVVSHGPELLPNGGMEADGGPWTGSQNAECKGGTAGIDGDVRHGGARSFRIASPEGVSGMAVNVCVWGWGGPGPSMTLAAGRTYEFSAWVRTAGAAPQLRLSLPEGAAGREEAGTGETEPGGWWRLFVRATMAADAKPRYLAVWLQGPGEVWCDDLSLREVEVPPFELECDRRLVDGTDTLVPVRISRRGGRDGVGVRVTLPGGLGERVVEVPAGGSAEVEFAASELAEGRHELRAEPAGGAPRFSVSLEFERVRGAFE